MSVLIKGMDMPTSCYNCPLAMQDYTTLFGNNFNQTRNSYACVLTHKAITSTKRNRFCPLVPVPPHGRLIDADALLERFEKEEKAADEHGRDFSFSFKSGGENCTEWWPVQQMLMDAPTIIETEEE